MASPNDNIPQFLNTAADNKFKINFSNMPNFVKYGNIDVVFNRFVREVTLPSYELELEPRYVQGSVTFHPISQKNNDPDILTITFALDENALNYYNFQHYIKRLRYGQDLPENQLHRNLINSIDIIRLDNESREVRMLRYKDCFPTNLGNLSMKMGSSDIPEFDVSFIYTEMVID